LSGEIGRHGGRRYGHHLLSLRQRLAQFVEVVNVVPRLMSAVREAIAAPDAHVGIDPDIVAAPVVAVLHGTGRDAGVAIDAPVLVNPDDGPQFHKSACSPWQVMPTILSASAFVTIRDFRGEVVTCEGRVK